MIPDLICEFVTVCRELLTGAVLMFGSIVAVCLFASLIFMASVCRK